MGAGAGAWGVRRSPLSPCISQRPARLHTLNPSTPLPLRIAAGAVPALVAVLQPPKLSAAAQEAIFEAAWALTNLAVVSWIGVCGLGSGWG